jgi:hypothetical protein
LFDPGKPEKIGSFAFAMKGYNNWKRLRKLLIVTLLARLTMMLGSSVMTS